MATPVEELIADVLDDLDESDKKALYPLSNRERAQIIIETIQKRDDILLVER